jgi:hypothetical protein
LARSTLRANLLQPYCNASSKRLLQGAGGTILHIRKDMRVGVKCDRGARVPQHLGDELGIDVSPQQKRNATFSHSCSVSISASPHWWPSQACYAVHPRPSTGNGHPSRFRARGPKNPQGPPKDGELSLESECRCQMQGHRRYPLRVVWTSHPGRGPRIGTPGSIPRPERCPDAPRCSQGLWSTTGCGCLPINP